MCALEADERLVQQALQLGQEAGQPDTAMIYGGTIAVSRMFQGKGAEVIALIERMVAEYPGVPAWEAASPTRAASSTAAPKAR